MGELLNLQQPLLDGGIRSVNFFNGRLLTGKDLSREQDARRASDWRLGQAIGDGVAFGLDVSEDINAGKKLDASPSAVLRVSAGLAINRNGQVLRLAADTNVRLVRAVQVATEAAKIFRACDLGPGGRFFAGAGLYLLTIAPAEASEGSAPTNGLDPLNVRCNTDATVEGVQFRLLPVTSSAYGGTNPDLATFRNDLAYRCFGSAARSAWLADPFGASLGPYGMVDDLRASVLTDCDVPLALVFMMGATTIRFIDAWAVRRAPNCHPETPSFMPLMSARRAAEGQAMFFQFQAHVESLRTPGGSELGGSAASAFSYLPPVGVIPVKGDKDESDPEARKFFAGLTIRGPAFINAARVEMLVRLSVLYPPIDTASREVVWLYRVRENAPAGEIRAAPAPQQQYIVFASGHIPYLGDAQFDLAYWNNSNYALDR